MAALYLALSDAERALLVRMLEASTGDLRVEIRHTDTPSFKDNLESEYELLRGLLTRLRQNETTPKAAVPVS